MCFLYRLVVDKYLRIKIKICRDLISEKGDHGRCTNCFAIDKKIKIKNKIWIFTVSYQCIRIFYRIFLFYNYNHCPQINHCLSMSEKVAHHSISKYKQTRAENLCQTNEKIRL